MHSYLDTLFFEFRVGVWIYFKDGKNEERDLIFFGREWGGMIRQIFVGDF